MAKCATCGRELPEKSTRRRRYCGSTCRKRAERARKREEG
jgi:hypothetical protein